ncbi:MAG TPA: FAD/NAD(P)-binding protein [Sphingomicrobium sp.]|nr:FAD/NAD(P)-binding protein [Sphingomicrobium sp.]
MRSKAPVAIVGAGFSGTMLAAELARREVKSVLFEGSGREGRGTAYSTIEPAHLLNVPAAKMSAWADDPDHFARVIEAEGGSGKDFAERQRFGRYLRGILDEAVAEGMVEVVPAHAISARRDESDWRIAVQDGGEVTADALVLAQGNQPPEPLRGTEQLGARFVNNPWIAASGEAIARVADSHGDALIIGTGLTMIDMVLSLEAAGHRGRIMALSRRGQIPRSHADFVPAPVKLDQLPLGNVGELWRWLRRRAGQVGWRAAVDSWRPHSHAIWRSLDSGGQRQFVRHARPWWDVHRHRIAPQVAKQIADMVAEGRLEIVAGRIGAMREAEDGIEVTISRRGRPSSDVQTFAAAFNCTGPLGAISRTRDPMLRQMLEEGLVRGDALGISLAVDDGSRAGDGVWALGPLTKGAYWEIVAVPDIRGQAAAVAEAIAKELKQ